MDQQVVDTQAVDSLVADILDILAADNLVVNIQAENMLQVGVVDNLFDHQRLLRVDILAEVPLLVDLQSLIYNITDTHIKRS